MPTAYKLFRKQNGKLQSFNRHVPKSARFIYDRKKVNKPKVGRFFVFKRLKDARSFLAFTDDIRQIWKVKVDGLRYQKDSILMLSETHGEDISTFWMGKRSHIYSYRNPPTGTYTCGSVKLIKKVK